MTYLRSLPVNTSSLPCIEATAVKSDVPGVMTELGPGVVTRVAAMHERRKHRPRFVASENTEYIAQASPGEEL